MKDIIENIKANLFVYKTCAMSVKLAVRSLTVLRIKYGYLVKIQLINTKVM